MQWPALLHREAVINVCITTAADDYNVFIMTTVMNAPAIMSTVSYGRLAAIALHVVKPDLSRTRNIVVIVEMSTISPAHEARLVVE